MTKIKAEIHQYKTINVYNAWLSLDALGSNSKENCDNEKSQSLLRLDAFIGNAFLIIYLAR